MHVLIFLRQRPHAVIEAMNGEKDVFVIVERIDLNREVLKFPKVIRAIASIHVRPDFQETILLTALKDMIEHSSMCGKDQFEETLARHLKFLYML